MSAGVDDMSHAHIAGMYKARLDNFIETVSVWIV